MRPAAIRQLRTTAPRRNIQHALLLRPFPEFRQRIVYHPNPFGLLSVLNAGSWARPQLREGATPIETQRLAGTLALDQSIWVLSREWRMRLRPSRVAPPVGDKNLLLGRAAQLASRGQRRARPRRDEGEHTAAGGRGVKRKLVRREMAGATDGPGGWRGATRGGPGRTTPFGEAAQESRSWEWRQPADFQSKLRLKSQANRAVSEGCYRAATVWSNPHPCCAEAMTSLHRPTPRRLQTARLTSCESFCWRPTNGVGLAQSTPPR